MFYGVRLVCSTCGSNEFMIREMTEKQPSTDIKIQYYRLYCPHCMNESHTAMIFSGIDSKKLKNFMQNEVVVNGK
jgi:hypothetical protein